jgi:hypothetical protein
MLMVQVEVQVGAWLMHLFMVQVDYRLRYTWYMVDAWFLFRFIGTGLQFTGISHSDSVTVVPSFYFYFRVAGWGKDRWL